MSNHVVFANMTAMKKHQLNSKVKELLCEGESEKVLRILEKVLNMDTEVTVETRELWHMRAMTLNSLGRPIEAIVILNQLCNQYPNNFFYQTSYNSVQARLFDQFIVTYTNNRTDPSMEKWIKVMYETGYVSWYADEIYFDYLVHIKNFKRVEKRLAHLLELSPADFDYLSKAMTIADQSRNIDFIKYISKKINDLILVHPYRAELLDQYQQLLSSLEADKTA